MKLILPKSDIAAMATMLGNAFLAAHRSGLSFLFRILHKDAKSVHNDG